MLSSGLKRLSPWTYPLIGFAALILMGTGALLLFPTSAGTHLSPVDALFTATSATCVTGLIVVDTGKDLSVGGQWTVLILIQLGGLGIVTFSTLLLLVLGRSIPFRSRYVVEGTYSFERRADFLYLIRNVIAFTFVFEAAGALLLFLRFRDQFDTGAAIYQSLFHAVSAFCNAGFSLFPDSLVSYRGDFLVNLTMAGLIIIGGTGFVVLHEMVRIRKSGRNRYRFWNQISLHSKIVLAMTFMLLISGTVLFAFCEWGNTLKHLPFCEKILAAFFQSTTTRTAGFNTLDFGSMNNITLLVAIIFMFIGASPGSTGGGVKASTVGVLLALSRARLKGSDHVHAFKRAVTEETIDRAFAICALSIVIVIAVTGVLLGFEGGFVYSPNARGRFIELLFESTSAFGTVGLSMGGTASLSTWGKLVLVGVMFSGRLGPLVIATAIRSSRGERGSYRYAEEPVMIG